MSRRLPIPKLENSLENLIKSIEPFIDENNSSSFNHYRYVVKDFHHGLGRKLQNRLLDIDKSSPFNWLDDKWWIKVAYHSNRSPLLINSNWWLLYKNDKSIPFTLIDNYDYKGYSQHQILRAAWLTSNLVKIKRILDEGEVLPDLNKAAKWFGERANKLFGLSRLPQFDSDVLTNIRLPNKTKHIILLIRNQIFKLDIINPSNDEVMDYIDIANNMQMIINKVESMSCFEPSIGILTTENRDVWAEYREKLRFISDKNIKNFDIIENSLFAVSLDDYTLKSKRRDDNENVDGHMVNISSGNDGQNRWFDKSMNLIVENNSRAGMNGEHSFVEALVPSIVADYTLYEPLPSSNIKLSKGNESAFELLKWQIDDGISHQINKSLKNAKLIIDDSEPSELFFTHYGCDWIKEFAGMAPDAYIQMALQLAWYKNQNYFTATYETASTRIFENGRTETLRSFTNQSKAFVLNMLNPEIPPSLKYKSLVDATSVHNSNMRNASVGRGFDRHLLGLKLLLRDGESHEFFTHELFNLSSEWKLSTSGLSAGPRFKGTGFGAIYHDGYGINYMAGKNELKFGIESKVSCDRTSTYAFKKDITNALNEMKEVCIIAIENSKNDVKCRL